LDALIEEEARTAGQWSAVSQCCVLLPWVLFLVAVFEMDMLDCVLGSDQWEWHGNSRPQGVTEKQCGEAGGPGDGKTGSGAHQKNLPTDHSKPIIL